MTRILNIRLAALLLVVAVVALALFIGGCSQKSVDPTEVTKNAPSFGNQPNGTDPTRPGIPNVSLRLASDPRLAVILEAFYSLDPCHCGSSNKSIGPWAAGDWHYLTNDMNAYNVLKGWYGSNSSTWGIFYSNPGSYDLYGGYGHGGQCVYFANLLTYRSAVYQAVFPSYAACLVDYNGNRRYTKPYRNIQPGDIIRTYTANGHTAIVVAVLSGAAGSSVTSVDVIDANYIGNEIIGRHIISTSGSGNGNLANYYAVDLIALGGR